MNLLVSWNRVFQKYFFSGRLIDSKPFQSTLFSPYLFFRLVTDLFTFMSGFFFFSSRTNPFRIFPFILWPARTRSKKVLKNTLSHCSRCDGLPLLHPGDSRRAGSETYRVNRVYRCFKLLPLTEPIEKQPLIDHLITSSNDPLHLLDPLRRRR